MRFNRRSNGTAKLAISGQRLKNCVVALPRSLRESEK
jgi:hypothetical protein